MPKREPANASTGNGHQPGELDKDPTQMQNGESTIASTENGHQRTELVIDIPEPSETEMLWPECCIYKVPENLYNLKERAYTPQLISIGPLHHGNPKLHEMQEQKLRYWKEFRNLTERTMEELSKFVKGNEECIRRCYSKPSKLSSVHYVTMILLDAAFIIVLFKKRHGKEYDCILKKLWLQNGIQADLILLENQLPYSVLVKLYDFAFPDSQTSFHELTFTYFQKYNPASVIFNQTGVLHFTDLLRYFIGRNLRMTRSSKRIKSIQSATKLHEAGVELKGIKKASIPNIDFQKSVLTLPQFKVDETTECVFRNLMALEQCHYPSESYICSYIFLMDFLINTVNDVDLLIENEVIIDWPGGAEAVADMVNMLCINIEAANYFHDISERLNTHCKRRRYRCLATLRGVYFSNFWRGTSTLAASFLLLLTLAQTIFTILQGLQLV